MTASPRPRPALRRLASSAALVVALTACGGPTEPPGTLDQETFVATYVDLRLSALGTPTGVVTDEERARVLEKHGVSEEALLAFAEIRGSDPVAMRAIWEEVQRRLRAAAGEDTTQDRSGAR